MLFKSTALPVPDGATRRPFSSTSDRCGPRSRKSTVAGPAFASQGRLDVRPLPGITCGIWLSGSSIVAYPVKAMSSLSIVVSGLSVLKSRRLMREPVTTISSMTP